MSFADWEMIHQGLQLDPMLQAISDFLDNEATIIEAIQSDLQRGLKNLNTVSAGLPTRDRNGVFC